MSETKICLKLTMTSKTPLALSPSRAADYKQCPLLYRLKAIDKLPEPKTIAQVKGTLVHAVLEELHGLPREQRTYPAAIKMVRPRWDQMTEEDPALNELVPVTSRNDFFEECRPLIRGYFEMENPAGFDAAANELEVKTILPNNVPVRGFIDRVDVAPTGEVRVVDYKTGKKPPPRFKDNAVFQMTFYGLVYWRLRGVIPTQLRLMYLKNIDSIFITPSREVLEHFERDLEELWAKIVDDGREGTFQPRRNNLCGWCNFQDYCPEYGGTPPEYPGWPGAAGAASSDDPQLT